MPRQYVTAKFRPTDKARYSYHWDGDVLLVPGDVVNVLGRGGKTVKVTIADVGIPKPTEFETKPILGRAEPEPEAQPAAPSPETGLFGDRKP